jgi:mono/diheme cytochrome c family protein
VTRRAATLATAVAVSCANAFAAERTTDDGAFTVEQAARGKLVYDEHCVACHQADYYVQKLLVWQGASVGELFGALSATMPSANPGSLSSAQYLDVLAYIFSVTGSPAGDRELALTNMDAIAIVARPADVP